MLLGRTETRLDETGIIDSVEVLVGDGRSRTIEFRDVDREWLVV